MPENEAKPNLTIDFVGLCAFVADADCRDKTTRVDVLVLDAQQAAPDDDLCHHDPLLFFRKKDVERLDLPDRGQQASWTPGGENFGVFNLRGRDLTLDNVAADSKKDLKLCDSYRKVISLDKLTQKSAAVQESWIKGPHCQEVVARLRIEHGTLTGERRSDRKWCLAKPGSDPNSAGFFYFRQIVRWEVFAHGAGTYAYLKLRVGKNGWIDLKEHAHLVVSNLCPLKTGGGPEANDVLAFYSMAKDKVAKKQRLVLHAQPSGPAGGAPTRPGSEACPPVTGFVDATGASS